MIRFIFALCILIPATAVAFPNEPTGFRNLTWGEPVSKVAGLRPAGKPEGVLVRYMKMDESFQSEGITLVDINYVAEQGKLVEAVSLFDCAQYDALKGNLVKKYGPATTGSARSAALIWQGQVTSITLAPVPAQSARPEPNKEPALCSLTYTSRSYLKKNATPVP